MKLQEAKVSKLQEIAKQKGKLLFIESVTISMPNRNLLIEKKNFDQFSESIPEGCVAILRDVPVTKFTKNLNDRIYPKQLWEKIFNEGVAENTLSLADHPEDDGSITRICGLWKNFRIRNDDAIADWYLIGKWGEIILAVLKLGGKIGTSSVGFGELGSDETTVIWNTYELVRLGDAVLEPSQGVFATNENLGGEGVGREDEGVESGLYESTKKTLLPSVFEKSTTNKIEKSQGASRMDKAQELHLINTVKLRFNEARKKDSLVEKNQELQDVLADVPEHLTEVRSRIQSEIDSTSLALSEGFAATKKKAEASTKELSVVKEKFDIASSALDVIKTRYQEVKRRIGVYSHNEKLMEKDIKQLLNDRKLMEADVNKLVRLYKEQKNKVSLFAENSRAKSKDIKHLLDERKLMLTDIKTLVQERKTMKNDINQLLRERKVMLTDIKALVEDNQTMKKDVKKLYEMYKQTAKTNKLLKEKLFGKKKKAALTEEDYSVAETADEVGIGDPTEGDELDFASGSEATALQQGTDEFVTDELGANAMPSSEDVMMEDFLGEADEEGEEPEEDEDENSEEDEDEEGDEEEDEDEEETEESFLREAELEYGELEFADEFDDAKNPDDLGDGFAGPFSGLTSDPALDFQAGHFAERKKKSVKKVVEAKKKKIQGNAAIKQSLFKLFVTEAKKTPALKAVKEQIIGSKSLAEAVNKIKAFRSKKAERPFTMTESAQIKSGQASWLGQRF